MLIAFLADIHANEAAMAACLEQAHALGADHHVFLGDHLGYGPDPVRVLETVQALVERGAVAVVGNHDLAVLGRHTGGMSVDGLRGIAWTRSRLEGRHLEFLSRLPLTVEENGRLYVHANAWSPAGWEYITGVFDAARSMNATRCGWTFCGHVHTPALYHMTAAGRVAAFAPSPGVGIPLGRSRRWLTIVGSAGQPRDGNPAASFALLDADTMRLTFFRIPYDYQTTARRIREAGLPTAFADRLQVGA